MARPIVKYLDPISGEYEFATVVDVGDLRNLNTTIKSDIVGAINSIVSGGGGLEDLGGILESIKDGTFNIEDFGSIDEYLKQQFLDELDRLNAQNKAEMEGVLTKLDTSVDDAIRDYQERVVAQNIILENAENTLADARSTLEAKAEELETANIGFSELEHDFNELDNYISTNVRTIDFDNFNAMVEDYESVVTQTSSEVGVDMSGSTLSYLTGRVTDAEANISAQADEITSKMGYDEFQYMPVPKYDYGENLLFDTFDFGDAWTGKNGAQVTPDTFLFGKVVAFNSPTGLYETRTDDLTIGESYVFSTYVNVQPSEKSPSQGKYEPASKSYDPTDFTVQIGGASFNPEIYEDLSGINGWVRINQEFVADAVNPIISITPTGVNSQSEIAYMAMPKLEKGLTVTPWQPHVEDNYATLSSTQSMIKQQANSITAFVTGVEELDDSYKQATSTFQMLADGFKANTEAVEAYEDAVTRYGTEYSNIDGKFEQKVWKEDFDAAIEDINIDNRNRVLNSDFIRNEISSTDRKLIVEDWSLNSDWEIKTIDGNKYLSRNRTGLTQNLITSASSNYFPVRDGERILFGFELIHSGLDDDKVFAIELFDINDKRLLKQEFSLSSLTRVGNRYHDSFNISTPGVQKGRVVLQLPRNGIVSFTKVSFQNADIGSIDWSPAPEDSWIIQSKLESYISQVEDEITIGAVGQKMDTLTGLLTEDKGTFTLNPDKIATEVFNSETYDDMGFVNKTNFEQTADGWMQEITSEGRLAGYINATPDTYRISFDKILLEGTTWADALGSSKIMVTENFALMGRNGVPVLNVNNDGEVALNIQKLNINSLSDIATSDGDNPASSKELELVNTWIEQDAESVAIGAIGRELDKSKTDPNGTFGEVWSEITVAKDNFDLAVSKDGVIQSINGSNEGLLIDFDKVNITGELLAALISAEKIDITDNFGIYYQDKLVFGVDAPTQAIHINSNDIMVNGKKVAIIDDVLTVDGKVIDLTGRVDEHDTQLSNIAQQVLAAIAKAEQAKKDAQKAYEDAVAEAEAKVQAKDKEYKLIFDDYDSTVESIEADTQTAKTKAEQALTDVGISTNLAQTAKDLATTAQSNASTALSNASQAVADANTAVTQAGQAVSSANTAKTNAQTAINNAQSALTTAGSAKTTADNLSVKVNDLEGEVELKATQTEVDGISGTVSTHSTTLGQHATAIASKASSELVNTIKGTVDTHTTEISQNATDIASKASSSSVNALTGRVSTAESNISQNATAISTRLTSSQVNSLVDGKGFSTVTYVDNQITATAEGFGADLTRVEGKIPTDYQNENLLSESTNLSKWRLRGTNTKLDKEPFPTSDEDVYRIRRVDTSNTIVIGIESDTTFNVTEGQTYTLSFDFLDYFGGVPNYIYIMDDSTSGNIRIEETLNNEGLIDRWVHNTAQMSRQSVTFTMPRSVKNARLLMGLTDPNNTNITGFYISRIKIEKGNKATPYAISSEDFAVFKNNYQSTVDGITSELSKTAKTTDLNGMVTESYLATNQYTTQGQINTQLIDYLKTTDLNGKLKETVAYQDIKETTDRYTRVIGSTDEESRTKIAQIAMTDSLFQTTVRDSVDIGGANIVPNTDMSIAESFSKVNYWSTGTTVSRAKPSDYPEYFIFAGADNQEIGYTVGFEFGKASGDGFSIIKDQVYTLSFSAIASKEVQTPFNYMFIMRSSGNNQNIYESLIDVKMTQVGVAYTSYPIYKYEYTFKANWSDTDAWLLIGARTIRVNPYQWIRVAQIQLEKGNVATDWAPSPLDKANQSQVTQLADSWALRLKSGNDIKTQINASTDSIRLQSKFIHLNGSSLIDNATIKSAHIDSLNANKITGNTADFNTIRTGVLTANAVEATHIKADTALFDTLFSTTSATNRLVAQGAWITNANIINLNADKITSGTINANRISISSLANLNLGGTNLLRWTNFENSYDRDKVTPWSGTVIGSGKAPDFPNTWIVGQRTNDAVGSAIGIQIGSNAQDRIYVKKGKTYTLSFLTLDSGTVHNSHYNYVYLMRGDGSGNQTIQSSFVSKEQVGIAFDTMPVYKHIYTFNAPWDSKEAWIMIGATVTIVDQYQWIRVAEVMLEEGNKASAWSPSPLDQTNKGELSRTGTVEIHGGNIKADTLDVRAITGDKAKFLSLSFESLNSNMKLGSGAIRIQNSAGDFATMNTIPEFRSQDSAGTAAIMGKGRSHYYSGNQNRFYIGSNLEGLAQYGVHVGKNQTWGIYRPSNSYGGTPAQYYNTPRGWGAVQVVEELMRLGYVSSNFNTAAAFIKNLNGWGSTWPVLQPGEPVMYKAAVAGNSSGVERIWTMGTSSNGATRIYSHVYHAFEGGTSGTSDRRLKHDIEPTQVEALAHIESLAFKEFKWNKDNRYEPLGLIAQDSGIIRVPDDEMEGYDIQRAIMLGLKGVQELQEIVKEQAEKIKQLEERINK